MRGANYVLQQTPRLGHAHGRIHYHIFLSTNHFQATKLDENVARRHTEALGGALGGAHGGGLGALLGRRLGSAGLGRATTAARQAGRAAREREDVAQAEVGLDDARERLRALEAEFQAEVDALAAPRDPVAIEVEEERVTLRKGDVDVVRLALAWSPDPGSS